MAKVTNCNSFIIKVVVVFFFWYANVIIESMLPLDSKYCCVHPTRGASPECMLFSICQLSNRQNTFLMGASTFAVLFPHLDTEKKEHSSRKSLKVVQKVKKRTT